MGQMGCKMENNQRFRYELGELRSAFLSIAPQAEKIVAEFIAYRTAADSHLRRCI